MRDSMFAEDAAHRRRQESAARNRAPIARRLADELSSLLAWGTVRDSLWAVDLGVRADEGPELSPVEQAAIRTRLFELRMGAEAQKGRA